MTSSQELNAELRERKRIIALCEGMKPDQVVADKHGDVPYCCYHCHVAAKYDALDDIINKLQAPNQ